MSSSIPYDFEPEYTEDEFGRSDTVVNLTVLTVTSRGSYDYGSKSRDTVKMAATSSKMAVPICLNLDQFYKVIFLKSHFL